MIDYESVIKKITILLPKRLKLVREIKSYSQEYVALRIGVSQTTYGNYERGYVTPKFHVIQQLCEVFELTVNELLADQFDTTKFNL